MRIELSYMTGIFTEYEVCTDRGMLEYGLNWHIYVDKKGVPMMVTPANCLRIRYRGIVFETLGSDEQLRSLKEILKADFALEDLG